MKTLYLYSDGNAPAASAALRAIVVATGIPFTELRLDHDTRIHNVKTSGIVVVIDVDGRVWNELIPVNAAELTAAWNAAPAALPPVITITSPAKVRTPVPPFHRPSATPTNKDIMDGLIVLYDLIMDVKEKTS